MKKLVLVLVVLSLVGFFGFAEGQKEETTEGEAAAEDVVKIGIVSPKSGNYADQGAQERAGMHMAVEDFNGMVAGKKIEIIEADSETNPDVAARRAKRLIQAEGVKFLMGGVSSSVAISVGAVCQEGGAIFIATNENSDVITGEQARPNVFRTGFSMAFAVRAPAQWVADNLGKKWYFITHDYSWGWSGTKWARKMIPEVGAEELGEVKVPLGTRDFSSYLMKVANSDADVAVITVGGVDGIALYRQLNEFGIFDKMDVWWTSIDYADAYALEPEQRGRHGNSETVYDCTPEMKAFSDRYAEEYPDLNVRVADNNTHHGWLSMTALLRGMEKAGSTDVSDVKKAMEGMTIEDNKLPEPTYIRPWDHQMLDTYFFGQDKKRPNPDFFDIIFQGPEKEHARTQEENPVTLDETPFP